LIEEPEIKHFENEEEEKTEMRFIDFTQGTTSAPSSVSE
jgi:hypothetical protein